MLSELVAESILAAALAVAIVHTGMAADGNADERARRFVAWHETHIRPLEIEVAGLWWNANVSGNDSDYRAKQEAETRLELQLSDRKRFAELDAIRRQPPTDRLLARQIDVLYLQYLPRQVDPDLLEKMVAKGNQVEQAFNRTRAVVDGKQLSDSEVRRILRESTDGALRQRTWEASKAVGHVIEKDLLELVVLRNEAARKLGFADYHVMQLHLAEQSQEQVLALFDDLDRLTREPFTAAKQQIDAVLAARYKIEPGELRPWHYEDLFFQEAPSLDGQTVDRVFEGVDILDACRRFYAGIGLPVDDVLERSDLYEKPGKSPHAFATDIDRQGDVRVLANIVPNRYWFETMLHELGHTVYSSKNIPASLPYVLRTDAHALATEGIAMMFERFADRVEWLKAMEVPVESPDEFRRAALRQWRNKLLVFSRWCQVMFRFEKELYGNPGGKLNGRWWELVEQYQGIRRPDDRDAPDYAAKIHVAVAPAYYHNYMMGELFASQVHHALVRDVLGGGDPNATVYVGNRQAGEFFRDRVFAPGRTLPWNELVRHATGDDLSPRAFAADLQSK